MERACLPGGYELREYGSFRELANHLDEMITELKACISGYLVRLETMRRSAQQSALLLQQILQKRPVKRQAPANVIVIGGIKVYVGPSLEQEIEVLEQVLEELNRRLQSIEAARKEIGAFEKFEERVRLRVFYVNGVPRWVFVLPPLTR